MFVFTIFFVIVYSKGACSMFGANGTAVVGGGLLQLRALDWDVDGIIVNNNNS